MSVQHWLCPVYLSMAGLGLAECLPGVVRISSERSQDFPRLAPHSTVFHLPIARARAHTHTLEAQA